MWYKGKPRKARINAGRGLSVSRNKIGTKTSALPARAGSRRAMKFVASMTVTRALVRRI